MTDLENLEPMSHQEATHLSAVELYVLKELTPDQEDRFEAHYFECPDCAQAVAVVQTLSEITPQEARPWGPRLARFAWFAWVPATAALASLVVFQNFYSIPALRQQVASLAVAQANTVIFAKPAQMGNEDSQVVNTPSATVEVSLPAGDEVPHDYPSYRVEISREGRELLSQKVPPHDYRLSVQVASQTLGQGSFDVVVYGLSKEDSNDGKRIGQYYFNIRKGDSVEKSDR
jgi:hypothetical protein